METKTNSADDTLAELARYERERDALRQRLTAERDTLKLRLQAVEAGLAKLGVSTRKKRGDAGRPRPPKEPPK